MLARDLQSIVLYDQDGKFVGVRRPNSKLPIEINGTKIVIEDAIGSTGLDLKVKSMMWYYMARYETFYSIWFELKPFFCRLTRVCRLYMLDLGL